MATSNNPVLNVAVIVWFVSSVVTTHSKKYWYAPTPPLPVAPRVPRWM
jgi:hypothetical protein